MAMVYHWDDLVSEALALFPRCDDRALRAGKGDIGALVMHLSSSHDLTFAEAAEMVAFRLPVFIEEPPQKLSA